MNGFRVKGVSGMCTRVAILVLLAGISVWGKASLTQPGFESDSEGAWVGPWGYGALGGSGGGRIVLKGEADGFVRSGDRAVRLSVSDDGNPSAVAWSGISQLQSCFPGDKVRAGVWVYYDEELSPPSEGLALAQLRLEYFQDDLGEQIIPTHISLSTPFSSSSGYAPNTWHLVQVYDRVPSLAQSVKFSILLLSQIPNHQEKTVWVDDAFLEFHSSRYQGEKSRL